MFMAMYFSLLGSAVTELTSVPERLHIFGVNLFPSHTQKVAFTIGHLVVCPLL